MMSPKGHTNNPHGRPKTRTEDRTNRNIRATDKEWAKVKAAHAADDPKRPIIEFLLDLIKT